MPPTTLSFFRSTAALRIGVAEANLATLSITFCRIALPSISPAGCDTALTDGCLSAGVRAQHILRHLGGAGSRCPPKPGLARLPHKVCFEKPQMPRHRPKIAIIVQKRPSVLNAPRPNQEVDGLPDGDAASPQGPEIAGGGDRYCLSCHRHDLEPPQQGLDFPGRMLAVEALQHLAEHQIPDDDFFRAQNRPQPPHMRCVAAIEKIDPDAAVDDDHPVTRPLRLRARSPRQRYLPNASPASRCRRSLTIKRSASSTVCFLVACPEALWASAISASSISILVRIAAPPPHSCVHRIRVIHILRLPCN